MSTAAPAIDQRRRPRHLGAVLVLAVVAGVVALSAFGAPPGLRVIGSVLFVLTVPGMLIIDLRRPNDVVAKVMLGIGASVSFHLVLASLWLVPHPLWIGAAVIAAIVSLEAAPAFDRLWATAVGRRPKLDPAGEPANVWVPLPTPTEERAARSRGAAVDLDSDGPEDEGVESTALEVPHDLDDEPGESQSVAERDAESREGEAAKDGDEEPAETTRLVSSPWMPLTGERPTPEPPADAQDADTDFRPTSDAETSPTPVFTAAAPPLDINTATVEDWTQLPGIGPVLAERIIEYRANHGPFDAISDLLRVAGIGTHLLSKIGSELIIHPRSGPATWSSQ